MQHIKHVQYIGVITILLLSTIKNVQAQNADAVGSNDTTLLFKKVIDLLAYANEKSISIQNNQLNLDKAKKEKLVAILNVIDVKGDLLSGQFTNNTRLGVSVLPAEAFGGTPGTFLELETGTKYNTNLTNYIEIKLLNLSGWSNLRLAELNINLTESNTLLSLKSLRESIVANYYNIVNLQAQIKSSKANLAISDTLFQITENKFNEGLVNQQNLNNSKINYHNTEENINQMNFLLEQYYISLKLLCDIPDDTDLNIQDVSNTETASLAPTVMVNTAELNNAILQEAYTKMSNSSADRAFLPTLSLQFSNSNNLYNTEFQPFSGNWINSNYIGLNLSIPIPSAQNISQKYTAKFDYQTAQNNTEQARIQAKLNQQTLSSEYAQSISQRNANQKILALEEDSFDKNKQLYVEGIIGLDEVLNSYNSMVNAQYELIASQVDILLNQAKIFINNTTQ